MVEHESFVWRMRVFEWDEGHGGYVHSVGPTQIRSRHVLLFVYPVIDHWSAGVALLPNRGEHPLMMTSGEPSPAAALEALRKKALMTIEEISVAFSWSANQLREAGQADDLCEGLLP